MVETRFLTDIDNYRAATGKYRYNTGSYRQSFDRISAVK